MVLKCVLRSALSVVVAAHSGLCSGPCPAHSQEALTLVQRHASTLPWPRDVDATNDAAEVQQKPGMDLAMKDLEIDEKHKACPAPCQTCQFNGNAGGVPLNNGQCLNFCSPNGYCGVTSAYQAGGSDCSSCQVKFELYPSAHGCVDDAGFSGWLHVGKPYTPEACWAACVGDNSVYNYFTIASGDQNCKCHISCADAGQGHTSYKIMKVSCSASAPGGYCGAGYVCLAGTCKAQYVIAAVNENICPVGYARLGTEAACQSVCANLGVTTWRGSESADNFPKGCYAYLGNGGGGQGGACYFNKAPSGQVRSSSAPICQACASGHVSKDVYGGCPTGYGDDGEGCCEVSPCAPCLNGENDGVCFANPSFGGRCTNPSATAYCRDAASGASRVTSCTAPTTQTPTAAPTTDAPTAAPTMMPTGAPTGTPTETPAPAPLTSSASASGDPHVTNIRGEKFDIEKSGQLEFTAK